VYGTRQNFMAQNQLGQLQDSERLAMNLVTNVVQEGGYFPNPTTTTPAAAYPAATVNGVAFALKQLVYGVTGDQIYVRYQTGPSDGVMDCNGQTNTTGAALNVVNTFYVNASQQLVCQVFNNGTALAAQPLVNNVKSMTVLYGVDTNGDSSADEYISAANMTATYWNAVVSIQITLTFTDPLTGVTAPGAVATVNPTLTRTIDLLNKI
jgi:type IV pilus assembly protein PilW